MKPQTEYLPLPSLTEQPSLRSPPALMPLLWSHSVLVNNHYPVSCSETCMTCTAIVENAAKCVPHVTEGPQVLDIYVTYWSWLL